MVVFLMEVEEVGRGGRSFWVVVVLVEVEGRG